MLRKAVIRLLSGSRDIAEVKQEEYNETLPGIEQRGAFKLKSGVG